MVELRPLPFGRLLERMLRELADEDSIFHLPRRKFFLGDAARDISVSFHGRRAATPFGPAAGPQSQMAQNLVLSWLAGGRIHELKTVQINDQLSIPRPCIDMQTIGYNVEWSQELKLEESLEEYVKGRMLIEVLIESGALEIPDGGAATLFDMSVGYDLEGVKSERVQAFIRGMKDASPIVDRLRREIPAEHRRFRDVDYPTRLSESLTLSTFHGCPPGEIEAIIDFLLRENDLDCIVKFNPMLLGRESVRGLLNDGLGYEDVIVPDSAFERDTRWDQAVEFVLRLGETARGLGRGFGAKFSNTLIVQNHRGFFSAAEKEMYLSGPPLHVLAIQLVRRFRERFGDRYPISFAAGVDRKNFPDAVALGLAPVTVCSDLLKPGGYGRGKGYFDELATRMDAVGAGDLDAFVLRAYGRAAAALASLGGDEELGGRAIDALEAGRDWRAIVGPDVASRWISAARVQNANVYADAVVADPRYRFEENRKPPRKIGSRLELFDCITCDKCVPVCPNDANFTFVLPRLEVPIVKVTSDGSTIAARVDGSLVIEQKHQIGNFADFCNECGNCDVFCPEDGGPYVMKPRFFGSAADWRRFATHDGFCRDVVGDRTVIRARFAGREFEVARSGDRVQFRGEGFDLEFDPEDPCATVTGRADREADLTYARIATWVWDTVASKATTSP